MWQSVRRRIVTDLDTNAVLFDDCMQPQLGKSHYVRMLPSHVMHVRTEFFFVPQEMNTTIETLPVHHLRQLERQVRDVTPVRAGCSKLEGKTFLVAEVFSPCRFASHVESMNFSTRSYDLKTGFDFRLKTDREAVAQELKQHPPELLILCPPCTDEGGWFNLNAAYLGPRELTRRIAQSRLYIRFCAQLFEQQLKAGKQALLEHPHGSRLWNYPEVRELIQRCHILKCHMRRFGLRLPGSDKLIRKATRLLVSHESMSCLAKTCPGRQHTRHQCHQPIAGSAPGIGSVSTFAGQYTPQFVQAVLNTVPRYVQESAIGLVNCEPEPMPEEVLMAKADLDNPQATDEQLLQVLDRLHHNLGHPPSHDLVRVLKHAHASDRSIALARKYECDLCKAHIRPHVPLPAKSSRVCEFNHTIGLDVKFLPGWKANQKIKALNVVCHGSCYQMMLPFHETETSALIRRLFAENWIRTFGPPQVILVDQARTNMGEALQDYLDLQGTEVKQIPGEAHWQLGRTENHGGWFARILTKVISEHCPEDKKQWEECVIHSHVKNSMIQYYGHTPHQHVFGRNPRVPSDLLDEPLSVVPATAGLSDEQAAKAQAIRTTARQAVIEMQDSQSLRRALAARPRTDRKFAPGCLVAYWRNQKFQAGEGVVTGGRWFGVAVVIGAIGRNYVVAHRRQIFRVAPEQLRLATSEESATVETPEAELLGIQDLIEGGTFRSKNFIDLVPAHYPPNQPVGDRQPGEMSLEHELKFLRLHQSHNQSRRARGKAFSD